MWSYGFSSEVKFKIVNSLANLSKKKTYKLYSAKVTDNNDIFLFLFP